MKRKKVTIIGGGVIGLCCAWYLTKEGHEVTVIDNGDITGGTSFGNAGYVSPSHFVPLASPYIIGKALKWMLNSASPFYIKPRPDRDLIRWGMAFLRSSRKSTMHRNIPPLNALLHFSRELMNPLREELGDHFRMSEKGCFMLYKTLKGERAEIKFANEALQLGIQANICTANDIQTLEPHITTNVLGGVLYPIDCHLHPGDFMATLKARLITEGVNFQLQTQVSGFQTKGNRVTTVKTSQGELEVNELVLAAGSWLPELCRMLGIHLLLQAGKGYSMTYPDARPNLCHPAILTERRVAMTPIGKDLRLGGTMEISGINHQVQPNRVAAIYAAAKEYYPGLQVPAPKIEEVWHGLRPLSPDGLPYIGKYGQYENLHIAGGHAMLGLSLSAATGKLIAETVSGREPTIGLGPFDPVRFSRPSRNASGHLPVESERYALNS